MRKIISFILVLTMILGSFGMAFAAPVADIKNEKCEDAVNLLMDLGVVSGYEDGTYRPEKIVTRAEMATLIIKALGLNDYAVEKSDFSDMAGHWADPYVAYASSLGFIAGYPDGTFRPNETVTYDEAVTMMVQALGYKGEYLVGGYPAAFITKAKTLGLLENITPTKAGANRGDVAILLFNALDENIVSYDKDGAIRPTLNIDSMLVRLGAESIPGAVVGMTGHEFKVDIADKLGAYVDTFYINDENEVIGFGSIESEFIVGDYSTDGAIEVGDVEYKIKDTVDLSGIPHFENGEFLGHAFDFSSPVEDAKFAVKISGKYITNIYSVSTWDTGYTIKWDEDLAEELAEDKTFDGKDFIYDEYDEIDHDEYVIEGVASLDKIKEGHVITYYVNDNDEVVKIEVGTKTVTGSVKKVSGDGDKYYINGVAYEIAADGPTVRLGDSGKFYLDFNGKIAFFDKETADADDYAVVVLGNKTVDSGYDMEDVMKVKLLTADGNADVYVIEEKEAKKYATDGSLSVGSIVKYGFDKNGELDVVEVVTDESIEGKLSTKGYFDGYEVAKEVVVFINDNGEYSVGKVSDIPRNETITIGAVKEDGEIVVIVLDKADMGDNDSVYGVIVDHSTVKNADDKTVYSIEMLVNGKSVEYLGVDDRITIPTEFAIYEVIFDGDEVTRFDSVTGTSITVAGIRDGNIQKEDKTYVEVSDDVIVYCVNDDEFVTDKKFDMNDISKNNTAICYEVDEDQDGYDIIIFFE